MNEHQRYQQVGLRPVLTLYPSLQVAFELGVTRKLTEKLFSSVIGSAVYRTPRYMPRHDLSMTETHRYPLRSGLLL